MSVGLDGLSALPPRPVIPGVHRARPQGGNEMVAWHYVPRRVHLFGDTHVTRRRHPQISQALEGRRAGTVHRSRPEAFDDVTAPNRSVGRTRQRGPKAKLAQHRPGHDIHPLAHPGHQLRARFSHRSRSSLPIGGERGKGDT